MSAIERSGVAVWFIKIQNCSLTCDIGAGFVALTDYRCRTTLVTTKYIMTRKPLVLVYMYDVFGYGFVCALVVGLQEFRGFA